MLPEAQHKPTFCPFPFPYPKTEYNEPVVCRVPRLKMGAAFMDHELVEQEAQMIRCIQAEDGWEQLDVCLSDLVTHQKPVQATQALLKFQFIRPGCKHISCHLKQLTS